MSTRQDHLPPDPNLDNSGDNGNPDNSGEAQPITQPIVNQPVPPTDLTAYVAALEGQIRDQTRVLESLSSRIDNNNNQPAPVARDVEASRNAFFADPEDMIDKKVGSIVSQQLNTALKPLMEFVGQFKAETEYDKIKKRLAAHPKFAAALADPDIVAAVDSVMVTQPTINEGMVQASILSAVGAKSMGLLTVTVPNGNNNQPAPTAQPNNSTLYPPHMRPSGSPTVTDAPKGTKRRALTENERVIMRVNGFKTEEEYWQWLEMPASEVSESNIGKPAAPAGK